MIGEFAEGLSTLEGKKLAFLDCGKRGGAPILAGIAQTMGSVHKFKAAQFKKTSAHTCAPRKLIDEIASHYDGVIYGVVN